MYQAKSAGREAIRFFAPELQLAVNTRAALERELREGIRKREFVLWYQPQVKRGRVIGAEALLRWNHPQRGVLAPAEFISLAEETGLITGLGGQVLEEACRQLAEETIAIMHKLRSRGVRFSLDDFGTGYSSMAYLKRLPLDQVKIDRTFVRDMLADATNRAIAQAIIWLSRAMKLSLIAEGVETEEQRACLAELGCDAYQGYLFSRPVPAQDFVLLL